MIALQIPYRLLALRRPERPLFSIRWQAVMGYALIALLVRELAGGCGGRPDKLAIISMIRRACSGSPRLGSSWDGQARFSSRDKPLARRFAAHPGLRALRRRALRRDRRPGPSQARPRALSACPRWKPPFRMRHRRLRPPLLDRCRPSRRIREDPGKRGWWRISRALVAVRQPDRLLTRHVR